MKHKEAEFQLWCIYQYSSFPKGAHRCSSNCTTVVVVQQGGGCTSVNLHSGPGLGTNKASMCLGQHASSRGILAPAFFFAQESLRVFYYTNHVLFFPKFKLPKRDWWQAWVKMETKGHSERFVWGGRKQSSVVHTFMQ